jgi:hypothetical protein
MEFIRAYVNKSNRWICVQLVPHPYIKKTKKLEQWFGYSWQKKQIIENKMGLSL